MKNSDKIELSIVLTLYNFASGIESLVEAIDSHIASSSHSRINYEILFIDDGSKDNPTEKLKEISAKNNRVRAITLFNNAGQQVAQSAGIDHANGNFIIIMDGDFENPIEEIIPLYEKIKNNQLDIVYTVTDMRQTLGRKITSKFFYWSIKKIFKINVIPDQLTMRIFTRQYANIFSSYRERTRTLIGINHHIGGKTDYIRVKRNSRPTGTSNYDFIKRLEYYFLSVVSLTSFPLDIVFKTGLVIFVATGGLGLLYLYYYFTENIVPGFTSIILTILFFGGLQLMFLGMIARYLSFIFIEVRQRPPYQIRSEFPKDLP